MAHAVPDEDTLAECRLTTVEGFFFSQGDGRVTTRPIGGRETNKQSMLWKRRLRIVSEGVAPELALPSGPAAQQEQSKPPGLEPHAHSGRGNLFPVSRPPSRSF